MLASDRQEVDARLVELLDAPEEVLADALVVLVSNVVHWLIRVMSLFIELMLA